MPEKCPVCDQEMTSNIISIDGGVVSESALDCKNKCYSEVFAYGTTEYYVVDEKFVIIYTMNDELVKEINKEIQEAINKEKENNRYIARILTQNGV